MTPTQYKLMFRVPPSHLEVCKQAVFTAGAGTYPGGMYGECCFEVLGMDQFRPTDKSTPFIGKPGQLERVAEYRVETLCVGEDVMRNAVKALRKAHPYDQIVIEVVQLVDIEGIRGVWNVSYKEVKQEIALWKNRGR